MEIHMTGLPRRGLLLLAVLLAVPMAQGADAGGQRGQGPPAQRKLVLVDRAGAQTVIGAVPGNIWGPRISPDGRRLAFTLTGGARVDDNMYIAPLMNPAEAERIGRGRNPYWSADGTRMFFSKEGTEILMWRRVQGDGSDAEQLAEPARAPESRSADGRILSYVVSVDNLFSAWTLDLTTRTRTPIPDSGPESLGTNISPDGRWIAYQSTKTGRHEVYVQPLGRPGPAVQVTREAGFRPLWSADMREMFFDDGKQQLWAVPIQTTPTFSAGTPVPLPIKGFFQAGV